MFYVNFNNPGCLHQKGREKCTLGLINAGRTYKFLRNYCKGDFLHNTRCLCGVYKSLNTFFLSYEHEKYFQTFYTSGRIAGNICRLQWFKGHPALNA
jgi:hypothetical protein